MQAKRYSSTFAVVLVIGFGAQTEAEAQPTLITSCPTTITASGSYKLANNLAAAPFNHCLSISSGTHNVTIDLDGFTIAGDGNNFGIYAFLIEGLTVRNGTIKNFGIGIYATGKTMLIERMTLVGNAGSGFEGGVENIAFKDNIVTGNLNGVLVGQGAVVSGNIVSANTFDGINGTLSGLPGGTFANNTVISNGGVGLRVVCPSMVTGNTLTANTGGNVVLTGTGCNRRLQQLNAAP
jgi:hypothetical protein